MRTFNKSLLTAAFIGTTALALPLMSQAQGVSLRLALVGGLPANTLLILDNQAGDNNTALGIISVDVNSAAFNTAFGGILDPSNTNIGASYNVGPNVVTQQSNTNLGLAAGVNSTLTFRVDTSDQGITGPNSPPKMQTSSSTYNFNLQPVGETNTFQSNVDVNNGQFTASTFGKVQMGANNDPNSGSASDRGNGYAFVDDNGYSFNSISFITVAPSTNNSGTSQVTGNGRIIGTVVPEPGSVAMIIGMGVSGSAFVLRRRRASK